MHSFGGAFVHECLAIGIWRVLLATPPTFVGLQKGAPTSFSASLVPGTHCLTPPPRVNGPPPHPMEGRPPAQIHRM